MLKQQTLEEAFKRIELYERLDKVNEYVKARNKDPQFIRAREQRVRELTEIDPKMLYQPMTV